MFGFLAPRFRITQWRQSYARICQHQRQLFGLTSLPFLSYEATFLFQLGIDFGQLPPLPIHSASCCRLRPLRSDDDRHDRHAAMFASAFGMVLVGVKLDDDVADSGRWYNRLARWKYRKPVAKAKATLDEFSASLTSRLRMIVESHTEVEDGAGDVSLQDYCIPTAAGFGEVFEGFGNLIAPQDVRLEPTLAIQFAEIGRHLGAAIVAWDCAVDFQKDRITGEFNPLLNESDVRRSFDYCLLQLAEIGWLLPRGSTSAAVIASVSDRVRLRRNSRIPHPVKTFERWGLLRQKGRAYARCDGCDAMCMVGDCCECIGGAGQAVSGCAECGNATSCGCPCLDGIFCCGDAGDCSRSKKADQKNNVSEEASAFEWCHGKECIVDDTLKPGGFVLVDAERVLAKSASGKFIEAGVRCKVVGTDPFGVTVQPL